MLMGTSARPERLPASMSLVLLQSLVGQSEAEVCLAPPTLQKRAFLLPP